MPTSLASRRRFLKRSVLAAATVATPLISLQTRATGGHARWGEGFGPLAPARCQTTGLDLIQLPPGFRYFSYGWTGQTMSDGLPTPDRHDGMAVVAAQGPQLTLVRNHEVVSDSGAFGPAGITFDPAAGGGTTTLKFDAAKGAFIDDRASLSGTLANCAGGPTPWGSWLTCEEWVTDAHQQITDANGPRQVRLEQHHGYVFEVPASGQASARPLPALGRFAHEAVAIHHASGTVFLTQDRHPEAGFYRCLPTTPGDLAAGGKLQMMCVAGRDQMIHDVPELNWLDVHWVDIEDPALAHSAGTTDGAGVFEQGKGAGGTPFRRLEGCWSDGDSIFFTSTSGGNAERGQVYELDQTGQRLRLLFESPGPDVLDYPDNLTVSPRGGILLSEDGARLGQMMLGLSRDGEAFPFAINAAQLPEGAHPLHSGDFRGSEWCGACFSPDGQWLFVNLQKPGVTLAITGPWKEGLL